MQFLPGDMVRVISDMCGLYSAGTMREVCKAWSHSLRSRREVLQDVLKEGEFTSSHMKALDPLFLKRLPEVWNRYSGAIVDKRNLMNIILKNIKQGKMPNAYLLHNGQLQIDTVGAIICDLLRVQDRHREEIMAFSSRARKNKWEWLTEEDLTIDFREYLKDHAAYSLIYFWKTYERGTYRDFRPLKLYYGAWLSLSMLGLGHKLREVVTNKQHEAMYSLARTLHEAVSITTEAVDLHLLLNDMNNSRADPWAVSEAPITKAVMGANYVHYGSTSSVARNTPSPFNSASIYRA